MAKVSKGRLASIFTIITLATFSIIVTGMYLYQKSNTDNNKDPDTVIVKVESDGKEKTDGASMEYSGKATLNTIENVVELSFTNPTRSSKNMNIEVVATVDGEDIVLAKSAIIEPGNKITSIKYSGNKKIAEGQYEGKFIIHFYNKQNSEEIVDSQIAITVHVE